MTTPRLRNFSSDNASAICPEALQAMLEANAAGHLPSYGNDVYTEKAANAFRDLFETNCDVYFVFNGTAANSLALASLCQSYHAVICHEAAHIETDECGAPEFYSNGSKLLPSPGPLGKLTPDTVRHIATKRTDIHYPRARALSLTQPTELGTVYTTDELSHLCSVAHELKMKVHLDGARFANAVASTGKSPAELTWKAGIDVLCFGGSKNGFAVGEAVVFFDRSLSEEFAARCKQAGQLASKMRFMSAPWLGVLKTGAYLKHAAHANAMAKRLAEGVQNIKPGSVLFPVQANAVFLHLTPQQDAALKQKGWNFYAFIGNASRFMSTWDTTEADVDALLADLREVLT